MKSKEGSGHVFFYVLETGINKTSLFSKTRSEHKIIIHHNKIIIIIVI